MITEFFRFIERRSHKRLTDYMKDKNVAGVMALFLGVFGVHRFYLGQVGLGILYCVFFWTGVTAIAGIIDAIILFSMDQDRFDLKYNWQHFRAEKRDSEFDRTRRSREREIEKWERRQRKRERTHRTERRDMRRSHRTPTRRSATQPKPVKQNPYKVSGVKKYKDYDFDGAIEDFEKALEIDEKDVATHFNLACAYSLNEEADQSFTHLDRAVELGFNEFDKIKQHDALAFVRIQPQYDEFVRHGYRLLPQLKEPKEDLLNSSGDLLEQLKKLGELRERGLLTETEFTAQKKKLLG